MATFMVAVDGSKNSHEAFDTACRLLNRGEDHLLIVTCAEKVQGKHLLPALNHKEKEAHEALTARVERAQKAIMEPFRELAEERGIKSTCIMLKGHHAGQMLCTLADERNVDFLVVGRYPSPSPLPSGVTTLLFLVPQISFLSTDSISLTVCCAVLC